VGLADPVATGIIPRLDRPSGNITGFADREARFAMNIPRRQFLHLADFLEHRTSRQAVVPKMSLTPGRIWRGAPSVGDDTTDILSRMLNFSETAIEKLYHEKVIHRTEPFTEPQVAAVNP
jgi:hypothetical protein